jgi:hypothetical protein
MRMLTSFAAWATPPLKRFAATQTRNAVTQRIAPHPEAIEWSSTLRGRLRNPHVACADKLLHASYHFFLEQQNPKGRQEKGKGGLTHRLFRPRRGQHSPFTKG